MRNVTIRQDGSHFFYMPEEDLVAIWPKKNKLANIDEWHAARDWFVVWCHENQLQPTFIK